MLIFKLLNKTFLGKTKAFQTVLRYILERGKR